MTLQEAIKYIRDSMGGNVIYLRGDFVGDFTPNEATAIATILNAVVKGELK